MLIFIILSSTRLAACIDRIEIKCYFFLSLLFLASERAHWVAPQAAWIPPGPPWEEEEEGEPWGSWALSQSQEDDRLEGQTLPQTETCRKDPDEENVSMRRWKVVWTHASVENETWVQPVFLAVLKCTNRERPSRRMTIRPPKEPYQPTFWTEKDSHELKSFPIWSNKRGKRRR